MRPIFLPVGGAVLSALLIAEPALAAEEAVALNPGDTAFILLCAALVMLMTPGLAMFYGGMVRSKNVLSILMQCLAVMAVVSVQWVLLGYTLAFGPDHGSLIGGLNFLGLKGVGMEPVSDTVRIPQAAFAAFQLMFAMITAALIAGSVAERMRFSAFVAFTLLWTTLIYDPLAHWVWGGGWMGQLGIMDFAGGTVVHISSGVSGLVAAVVLGKRLGKDREVIRPHHLPMTMLGAGLLWFGWFGFNAGSALAADGIAAQAFLVTNLCAAAGVFSWVGMEWILHGKPTLFGAASGAIAGLVCITPAAGFVSPLSAVVMGLLVGPLCYLAVSRVKEKFGYDDSLDAFGIHGVGGTLGALLTGIFASTAVNPVGFDGWLAGNPGQFMLQALGVAVTYVFAGLGTYIILKVISRFTELRVSADEEEYGLDQSLHGEAAYVNTDLSGSAQAS
ncbi:MAG TPA: ammonium transporter [Syntrophomonadaceae bacterium]|nr:ammonium transporter [Syntrophomonadaceae bacterium]HPU48962.1 ammonium transporter [Syntrophomonadaceae bacterium]